MFSQYEDLVVSGVINPPTEAFIINAIAATTTTKTTTTMSYQNTIEPRHAPLKAKRVKVVAYSLPHCVKGRIVPKSFPGSNFVTSAESVENLIIRAIGNQGKAT